MYEKIRKKFEEIVQKNDLQNKKYTCKILAKGFTNQPQRSFSKPEGIIEQNFKLPSGEYALAKGKEILVRSKVGESYGDAFTDKPKTSEGRIEEVFELVSGDRSDKAIFFATLNATLKQLGLIDGTIHCKEGDPEKCGEKLVEFILDRFDEVKVAHIGYQPGHLEACSQHFEGYVTDLNPENIGEEKFGREILDGTLNEEVIKKADVACITGSTLTNGALPELLGWCETYGTEPIIYGVTAKGAAEILGLRGFCPYGYSSLE